MKMTEPGRMSVLVAGIGAHIALRAVPQNRLSGKSTELPLIIDISVRASRGQLLSSPVHSTIKPRSQPFQLTVLLSFFYGKLACES